MVRYELDEQTEELLCEVVDFYSRLSPIELVKLSHVQGGPWDAVWNHDGPVNPGMKIDNEKLAAYYARVKTPFPVQ